MGILTSSQLRKKRAIENHDRKLRSPFRLLKFTPSKSMRAEKNGTETSPASTVSDLTSPQLTKNMNPPTDCSSRVDEANASPCIFVSVAADGTLGDGEQVPEIETVYSLSPSSTTTTLSPAHGEKITFKIHEKAREINSFRRSPNLSIETDAPGKVNSNDIPCVSPGTMTIGDMYISKEDLHLVMLDKESLEEYEMYAHEAAVERSADSEWRKRLIQEELDTLIHLTELDDDMNGHEFEPEAVEALGIVANNVCYLQKYYDVARCQYVFVPSVANTIMNGLLLEEASKHYFGKSDEFLISYAAALGSTIVANNDIRRTYMKNAMQEQKNKELMEHVDLKVDIMSEGSQTNEKDLHVSDLFLGIVSPRSANEVEIHWATTPTKKTKMVPSRRRAHDTALKLLVLLVLIVSFTYSWLGNQCVSEDTFMAPNVIESHFVVPIIQRSTSILQQTPAQELAIWHDVESSLHISNESPLPKHHSEVAFQSIVQKERLRRPIVPNLLY